MAAKMIDNFLYRQIDIWKNIDNTCAIRFRCFENLENKTYCVQSADYFYLPIDEKQLHNFDKQFVELFRGITAFKIKFIPNN